MSDDRPSAPQAPALQTTNPFIQRSGEGLLSLQERAANPFSDALFSDVVSFQPETTRLALDVFNNQTQGAFDRQRQDLVNQLENLGALSGTTTADSLSQLGAEQSRQQAAVAGQATLSDIARALQSRISLGQLSAQAGGQAGNIGLNQLQLSNAAKQANFENQIARQELERDTRGGFAGALTGGLGGALAGIALAPVTGGSSLALGLGGGLLGGAGGFLGPAGTGGSLLTGGATLAGSSFRPAGTGVGGVTSGFGSQSFRAQDPLDRNGSFRLLGALDPEQFSFGGNI